MSNQNAGFLDPVRPAWLRDGVRVVESADFNAAAKFLHARLPAMASSLGWPPSHRPAIHVALLMDQFTPGNVIEGTLEVGSDRDLLRSEIEASADGPVILAEIAVEKIDPSSAEVWTTMRHSGYCFRITLHSDLNNASCWMPISRSPALAIAYSPPVIGLAKGQ